MSENTAPVNAEATATQPLSFADNINAFAQAIGQDIKEIKNFISRPPSEVLKTFALVPSQHLTGTNHLSLSTNESGQRIVVNSTGRAFIAGSLAFGTNTLSSVTKSLAVQDSGRRGARLVTVSTENVPSYPEDYTQRRTDFINYHKDGTPPSIPTDASAFDSIKERNKILYNSSGKFMIFNYDFSIVDILRYFINISPKAPNNLSGGGLGIGHGLVFEFMPDCPRPTGAFETFLIPPSSNKFFEWNLSLYVSTTGEIKLYGFPLLTAEGSAELANYRKATNFNLAGTPRYAVQLNMYTWMFTIMETDSEELKACKREVLSVFNRRFLGSMFLM